MKLKKKSRDLVLAMALGDGYLSSAGYLTFRHSVRYKEYVEWKSKLLRQAGVNNTGVYYVSNNGYGAYECRTYNHDFIKLQKSYLYHDGKKHIASDKVLSHLDALGIAIWYMDDGSISQNYVRGKWSSSILTLCTCVDKDSNQVIIDYFMRVWGVKFGQRKMKNAYALVCRTQEARKFLSIVAPYVNQVECMQYKLIVKQSTVATDDSSSV